MSSKKIKWSTGEEPTKKDTSVVEEVISAYGDVQVASRALSDALRKLSTRLDSLVLELSNMTSEPQVVPTSQPSNSILEK